MIAYNLLVLTIVIYCEAKSVPLNNLNTAQNHTTAKDINFVEVIKQDLRRNNDDYKEITQKNNTVNNNRLDVRINNEPKILAETAKLTKRGKRRNNDNSYQEYDYEDTTKLFTDSEFIFKSHTNKSQVFSVTNKSQKIFIHRNQSKFDNRSKMLPTVKNFSFTPSMKDLKMKKYQHIPIPKFVKKNKIVKFKQFMKKNEGLLKDFISGKNAARTQKTFNGLRQFSISENNLEILKSKPLLDRKKKIQRSKDKADGELPSAELLDMAPAKGGRIHRQREKGRLCQRHVLMPEGPKYDSGGRWYLPAHELLAARPYPHTKRPKLLLPRCCNCCKKSALGCE